MTPSLFNILLYQKFKEKAINNNLKRKTFKKILNIHKIKSSYHNQILREMNQNKLIKIIDKQNIKLLDFQENVFLNNNNEVIKLYRQGMTQQQISKEIGISQKSVSCLLKKSS